MHDPDRDVELVKALCTSWLETRSWAEQLLIDTLDLARPEDVLREEHRGRRQLPGGPWWYRTHGGGVDVYQLGNKGGIDFDFNKPNPDAGLLREFMIKQLNAGHLTKRDYRPLLRDQARWHDAAAVALHGTNVDWMRAGWASGVLIGLVTGTVKSVQALKLRVDQAGTFDFPYARHEAIVLGGPVVLLLVVLVWGVWRRGFSINSVSRALIQGSPAVAFVLILHAVRAALEGKHGLGDAFNADAPFLGLAALIAYGAVVWRFGARRQLQGRRTRSR